jgi:hypothetical protein
MLFLDVFMFAVGVLAILGAESYRRWAEDPGFASFLRSEVHKVTTPCLPPLTWFTTDIFPLWWVFRWDSSGSLVSAHK